MQTENSEVFGKVSSPVIRSRIGDLEAQNTNWKDEDYVEAKMQVKPKLDKLNED